MLWLCSVIHVQRCWRSPLECVRHMHVFRMYQVTCTCVGLVHWSDKCFASCFAHMPVQVDDTNKSTRDSVGDTLQIRVDA